jgi:8-oxo-dGTP diphosphatase
MIKVAAALIKKSNQILVARRSNRDYLDGLWEFPGGKIEAGETPENCLRREILEELNIYIEVKGFFADSIYEYPGKRIHLLAYWANLLEGEIILQVHDRVEWTSAKGLSKYAFAPADIPIVEKIRGGKFV